MKVARVYQTKEMRLVMEYTAVKYQLNHVQRVGDDEIPSMLVAVRPQYPHVFPPAYGDVGA